MSADAATLHAERLFNEIRPILTGQGPEIQGAVIAQLLALWLAGHPSDMRAEILDATAEAAWKLTPIIEHEMFRGAGHPDDRA